MKKIIGLALICSLGTVEAKNMIGYRLDNYPDKTISLMEESYDEVSKIRELLGTTHYTQLDYVLKEKAFAYNPKTGVPRKPQSSGFFKNKLTDAAIKLFENDMYGAPVPYNPEWTLAKYRAHKDDLKKKLVISLLNKGKITGKGANQNNELARFLYAIETKLVKKTKEEEKAPVNPVAISRMKSSLDYYIRSNAPKNMSGQSIHDVLGKVSELVVNEGLVHKLKFKNNNLTTHAQLSMMLTFRAGEDEFFVKIQELLLDYLKEQKETFEERISQVEAIISGAEASDWFANSWKSVKYYGEALYRDLVKKPFDDALDAIYFLDHNKYMEKLAENDRIKEEDIQDAAEVYVQATKHALFLKKVKKFMENIELSTEEEKLAYMKRKVKNLSAIIPFLEYKLVGAQKTNEALKQLSTAQVDFLLDMFLRLRKGDILTKTEIVGFDYKNKAMDINSLFENDIITKKQNLIEVKKKWYKTTKSLTKLNSHKKDYKAPSITEGSKVYRDLKAKYDELKTDFYFYKIQKDQIYRLVKNIKAERKLDQQQAEHIAEIINN